MADQTTYRRLEETRSLEDPVSSLRFVSASRAQAFARLGVDTVRDLLSYFPFRYNDFSTIMPIGQVPIGSSACICGTVDEVEVRMTRNRCRIVEISVLDESGVIKAVWFNQPWIADTLRKGVRVLLQGTVEHVYGFRQMSSPIYSVIEESEDAIGRIEPVYHASSRLSTAWIARIEREAQPVARSLVDPLPLELRLHHGLMARSGALSTIHFPRTPGEIEAARTRIRYEELFFLQLHLMVQRNREDADAHGRAQRCDDETFERFLAALPFRLTDDQSAALGEIRADLADERPMHRMLFGDVGSGKTAVACGALFIAAACGSQAALMAPTEVLAQQYCEKIGPVLDRLGIPWALLTSSVTGQTRAGLLARLTSGDLPIVFGTHALLGDEVVFADLSLAIIDEQHRFGVEQRARLSAKGLGCDQLFLTATPIPRSLALTLYGDMRTTFLRTSPASRAGTTTTVLPKTDHYTAYEAVRAAVSAGHQAYIVCPLIAEPKRDEAGEGAHDAEPDEELYFGSEEGDAAQDLKSARREAAYLADQVFRDARVELLCGSMKPADKAEVMQRFRTGACDILVSTTVIEVGVDVPNATVMVIEDAERFGLAQLHQLRGRIGRGTSPGRLFLMAQPRSDVAAQRMEAMRTVGDGFELARLDLSLRKEGDLAGYRQHGDSNLAFVNIVRDAQLIEQVHADVEELIADDPCLTSHENGHLAHELSVMFPEGESNI